MLFLRNGQTALSKIDVRAPKILDETKNPTQTKQKTTTTYAAIDFLTQNWTKASRPLQK